MDSLPEARQLKVNSYGHLCLRDGDVVLDAGCGPGYDALRMAAIFGKTRQVTGIDMSERMIAIAKAKHTSLPVSFRTCDVRKLPFPDARFDKIRIERTLQILDTPGLVLDEMIRVLRPGGRLLSIEPDWETFVCDPGSRDTARTFFRFCPDQFPTAQPRASSIATSGSRARKRVFSGSFFFLTEPLSPLCTQYSV